MPEETNRVLVDHCSDYLFAPTRQAAVTLWGEGIRSGIHLTGNTIVDVVYLYMPERNSSDYMLLTLHRQENVDNASRFASILKGLELVIGEFKMPILYPIHPRSKKMLKEFHLKTKLEMIEPVDYFKFLSLEQNARLVLTDSGGVQEETCILGVPCVTLRDTTERYETVDIGANILAGSTSQTILDCAKLMLSRKNTWIHPFGNGKAGIKIVEILTLPNSKE